MDVKRQPIRILIVDAQSMFREGLRRFLENEPDLQVIADTGDADQVPGLVADCNPDILLIDVTQLHPSSGHSGLKLLYQLIRATNKVRPILMTSAIAKDQMFKALKIGVKGVLTKQSGIALFLKCIRTVMAGGYWISREIIPELLVNFAGVSTQLASKGRPADHPFSKREEQILRAILKGHSNREIAKELGVSEQTVKYHLTKIFRKAGVSSRMELARFAMVNGWVGDV